MAGTRLIGFTPILYLFREIFSSIVAGWKVMQRLFFNLNRPLSVCAVKLCRSRRGYKAQTA